MDAIAALVREPNGPFQIENITVDAGSRLSAFAIPISSSPRVRLGRLFRQFWAMRGQVSSKLSGPTSPRSPSVTRF